MLIRSITRNEPEGRTVDIDGIVYVFAPDKDGNNVAEVTEKRHVSRFLSLVEGYEIHDPSLKDTVKPAEKPVEEPPYVDPLAGSTKVEEVTDADAEAVEKEPEEPSGADYNGFTRKQLEKAYEEKFGKKPHPRAKDDTILTALTEK